MAAPPTGPVADFCAALRRLVRACGVPQKEIAASLFMSGAAVSELLNGRRVTPPDWDVVRRILDLCAGRCGSPPGSAPPDVRWDEQWWRGRHAELVRTVEASSVRGHGVADSAPPVRDPAEAIDVFAATGMDLSAAVRVLAAGREELAYCLDELLYREESRSRVLAALLEGFPGRVRAARGVCRAVLLQAARVVLAGVALAGCGADHVSRGGTRTLVNGAARAYGWPPEDEPSAGCGGPADPALREGTERAGLSAPVGQELLDHYLALAAPLAETCPEFGLSAGLPPGRDGARTPGPLRTGLAGLHSLLAGFTGQDHALPPSARALLDAPIATFEVRGPRLPSLADGYVNPRYRLTGPGAEGVQQGAASDKWWQERPLHEDLECFLAAHLLSLPALLSPLLVLGHPGAGKSLLTKLLTARLPAREFRPLRVELRHTPADDDLQTQLEHALRHATGRSVSWPDWTEAEPDLLPVVLLDGFDELLQAGAQKLDSARQWTYLRDIERFQRREAELGRPLAVLVTSRTVVADRAEIPPDSQVLRLEPFDEPETEQWLSVWNTTNRVHLERRGLRPLTPEALAPHRHLAAQPLLLLMLALYDADDNALHRLRDEDISRTELYERLLTTFVRRQLVKDGPLPASGEQAAIDRELHRLSVIAFGMFQRGAQAITGGQAEDDLRTLAGGTTDGDLLFGRFFFVHEAQAVIAEQSLRSYEFMHATFGEHLAARLVARALRLLPTRVREGHRLPDDGELYALLSYTPLSDRAQIVQNLADMLSARPPDAEREVLPGLLAELFREVPWETAHRGNHAHAPVRRPRACRDAVYSANLLLIGVLATGEVYASDFLGTDGDLIDQWRRQAMAWRAQMSRESWDLYVSTLGPERVWRPPSRGLGDVRPDLRIGLRRVPLVQHELSWPLGIPAGGTQGVTFDLDEGTDDDVPNVVRRVLFAGDRDAELLLHAAHPLLHRLPASLRTHSVDGDGHVRSAAHALVALLARDVYHPDVLPDLYGRCLKAAEALPEREEHVLIEALSRQLVHDAATLPDDALRPILSRLVVHVAVSPLGESLRRSLTDCLQRLAGRGDDRLRQVLEALASNLHLWGPRAGLYGEALLLELSRAGRSARTWSWVRSPDDAPDLLDECLHGLDLPTTAARHPRAVVDLLRLAAELGRADWLAAHTADLLVLLPDNAFGLLRPSDLGPLRDALPEGGYAYETEFAEVERSFRRPGAAAAD
ncbi:helix-turn-helix domain-containing protein [Streptomyces sp. NPDC051315]|uniref:helix-turn-helix domain-containing protein n=1 Tax=Streptomyces sp. NPDC051315 TaxID=3365650 RepID=UPI003798F5F5